MNILSALYGYAVAQRNKRYDTGAAEIQRVAVPVISVGNISAGGTGKTPFVQCLVRMLLSMGRRPAIVSRGYGRKSKGEVVVSNGTSVLVSVDEAGDELMLHAEALPVPVIAHADRAAGARTAVQLFAADVVVLDDGFQHRRLYRDCDIVLVDSATLRRPVLLPVGRLREPLASLGRADVVCGTGGVGCADIPRVYLSATALCVEARAYSGAMRSVFAAGGEPPSRVVAVSGIAHPARFFSSLAEAGVDTAAQLVFGDHYSYGTGDVRRVVAAGVEHNCKAVVTTEKDAVKLRRFRSEFEGAGVQLWALPLEMRIERGEEELRHKLVVLLEAKKR